MRKLKSALAAAAQAATDRATPRYARVVGYDPDTYRVKVTLEPEGTAVGGWIRLASEWVGNGWGLFAGPSLGDVVVLEFIDGRIDAPVAVRRLFTSENRPLPAPSGELWLVHKTGAFAKLLNSGALLVSDGQGASVQLNGDGTITSTASGWTHTGNFNLNGDMNATGTITGQTDVIGGGKSVKTLRVTGVQPGSGVSGTPA